MHVATTHDRALELAPSSDAIFALDQDISAALVEHAPKLKWIQALTSGTDSLAAPARIAARRDRHVLAWRSWTASLGTRFLADAGACAALPRDARQYNARMCGTIGASPRSTNQPLPSSASGAIGRALARRCKAFEMRVIGVDAQLVSDADVDQMYVADELTTALGAANFVVLLVPHLPATHHLMNARTFAAMRPSAFLINVSRGAIVDEIALRDALDRGVIAGARPGCVCRRTALARKSDLGCEKRPDHTARRRRRDELYPADARDAR